MDNKSESLVTEQERRVLDAFVSDVGKVREFLAGVFGVEPGIWLLNLQS